QKEATSLNLSKAEDKEKLLRKSVCDFMARGYRRHLFTQNLGVISARLDENSFLITESGSDNADLGEDEIVRISENIIEAGKVPSKSVLLHKKIYEENPEINAIIMAAPVNAMVFAVTDFNYDLKTIPECYIVLREDISKFPFGSVYKNREGLAEYFKEKAPVAIVENDCYICTGDSIYNAFDKLEVLDSSAEAVVNSKLLGGRVQTITEEQAQEIKERFK
ncbi:MAG: class II aldolase/adducin family protein, partial [Acetivibrio ethanolgignens]